MASMLTCEICLEKKSDRKPKSLNCLHSFCRDCLGSWINTRPKTGNIECPVCRQHTEIPSNGMDGLVDDFKVLQLEEMMKAIGDPLVCQGCLAKGQSSMAKAKCITCDRRLCRACHQYHLSRKIFEKHKVVTDLCEVHGNGISHVCTTCLTGLCVDCLLSEIHDGHDLYEMDEGILRLRGSIEERQKQINDQRENIATKLKENEKMVIQKVALHTARLKQAGDSMKQEIDRQVADITKQYRNQMMKDLKISHEEFEKEHMSKTTMELIEKDIAEEKGNMKNILHFIPDLNKMIRQIRNAEQQVPNISDKLAISKDILTYMGTPISLLQFYDKTSDADTVVQESLIKDMSQAPTLVFEKLSASCDNIGSPWGLEIMEDFTAAVTFDEQDHAVRFGENGKILASYYCDAAGDQNKVKNITLNNGHLYILCWDDRTVLHVTAESFRKVVMQIGCKVGQIYSITWDSFSNMFIISQRPPHGKVYKCRVTDMVPDECSLAPGTVRVLPYAGSYRIAVASWSTNTIMVYDGDETLLYTLKGCGENDHFNHPSDVALLGHDILLVADASNHRICKFNLSDGSFDGFLLSLVDGIHHPVRIACRFPYIWAAGRWEEGGKNLGSLKLFKWS